MQKKLQSYWDKVNIDATAAATVLDPRLKKDIVKEDPELETKADVFLFQRIRQYEQEYADVMQLENPPTTTSSPKPSNLMQKRLQRARQGILSHLSVRERQSERNVRELRRCPMVFHCKQ